jgi:hypothetical protein
MSGKRTKILRKELIALLGRAPQKRGSRVPRYAGPGDMVLTKDEFRVYKRAYRETRKAGA